MKKADTTGGLYVVKDGTLIGMNEEPFLAEKTLQKLLAEYPGLLAGDQAEDEEAPSPRWLLVSREMAVPGEEDGAGRWSLDHLFIDQDGVPTLVEVKRSVDTRIRREVVGQMLDYAANSVAYWPVEAIRSRFEARCQEEDKEPDEELDEFLGGDAAVEEFWTQVKTNLQAGKVRLVFVADQIPRELRRIVEFLNQQMDPAEVLALEVKEYGAEGQKVLTAKLVGQTAEAQGKKRRGRGARRSTKWTEEGFFASLPERHRRTARKIQAWAGKHGLPVEWGGGKHGSLIVALPDGRTQILVVRSVGEESFLRLIGGRRKGVHLSNNQALLTAVLDRLNQIPDVASVAGKGAAPKIELGPLEDESSLSSLLACVAWVAEQFRDES